MYRPLLLEKLPTFSSDCCVSQMRVTPKGIEIDFTFKAYHESKLLWESVMTLLSRNVSTRQRNKSANFVKKPHQNVEEMEGESRYMYFRIMWYIC